MALFGWSTTAGNNANVGSINWAEGMPPSAVNNSARQMMADVADYVNNPGPEWYQHDSAAYASGTTFTVAGDQTAVYLAHRRLRAVNASTTIYGSVVSATFSTNTTVTAVWDSGSLDAGLSSLKIGIIAPTNQSIPVFAPFVTQGITSDVGNVSISATTNFPLIIKTSSANAAGIQLNSSAGRKHVYVNTSSQFAVANSANSVVLMTIDDSGNLTAAANITANSDERLKDDWLAMPDDFCERLACVLSGSYKRTDLVPAQRQVGLGAQSVLRTLPELAPAVMEDERGIKSIAYGQAAAVMCVELAKELRRVKQILKKNGIRS